jgi:hypothetical protein
MALAHFEGFYLSAIGDARARDCYQRARRVCSEFGEANTARELWTALSATAAAGPTHLYASTSTPSRNPPGTPAPDRRRGGHPNL